jgi:hypothetical protein
MNPLPAGRPASRGARTFKLFEGEPLQTSFGEDLYNSLFGIESARRETADPMAHTGTL